MRDAGDHDEAARLEQLAATPTPGGAAGGDAVNRLPGVQARSRKVPQPGGAEGTSRDTNIALRHDLRLTTAR